jgi:hypothetical protein
MLSVPGVSQVAPIIIIIIRKDTIPFMQGIYTYIPETMSLRNTMLQLLSLLFVVPISCVGSNLPLHQHFPKCVCSAQYGNYYYYYYYYSTTVQCVPSSP